MEPLSKGEKMMNWVMKHVMPWFFLVILIFCVVMAVLGVIKSV